ncbi:MAG: aldo/keto reductase [Planctomycetes bacterium]|nr:aldo/keto reductase [Planctomycetota bacterium]
MSVQMNRRGFLRKTAGTGLVVLAGRAPGADAAEPLPTRVLGRTKAKVTILGLGTAPIGEGPVGVQEGARIFGEVLDRGVTYVDTARSYGTAEEALALVLPKRRDGLFLATKCWTESGAQAQKLFETSLRTLKVDHLDLVHIHNMGGKDPAKVLAKDGILEYLLKQKEAGKLRFIGLSGHERPPRYLEVLKTGQIDVVMPVMNYADRNIYGFEDKVLPECRKQNVGVVAMKVYVGIKGGFPNHRKGSVGCVTKPELMPQAIAYALDLEGVSVANIGPYTMEQAVQNVEFARAYRPLTAAQRADLLALGKEIATQIGPRYGPVV